MFLLALYCKRIVSAGLYWSSTYDLEIDGHTSWLKPPMFFSFNTSKTTFDLKSLPNTLHVLDIILLI